LKYYPVFLNIAGKKCVVVGGGEVAARKVKRLLDCGGQIYVISPTLTAELAELKAKNLIIHVAGDYNDLSIEDAALIIGATDDEITNAAVARDARGRGIPVNIVDDPQKCDFILPSVLERGDLTLAIGTGGKSPALARHLREELEARYGEEYGILLNILGDLRRQMKNASSGNAWFDTLLAGGILDLIRAHNWEKIKELVKTVTGVEVAIK